MKKILIITTLFCILPFTYVGAEEPVDAPTPEEIEQLFGAEEPVDVPTPKEIGLLQNKAALMAELRELKELKDGGANITSATKAVVNKGEPVEHPEFGLKDLYPDTPAPELDPMTREAISKTEKWLHSTNSPVVQKGKLIHPYGDGVPTVVLPPLSLSSIELNKDETIVSDGLQLADQTNFGVSETYSGSRRTRTPVLIVKSKTLDPMQTVLIVITTKRVYHVKIVSTVSEWTPQLSFSYPDDAIKRSPQTLDRLLAENMKPAADEAAPAEVVDSYLYALGDAEFNYKIKGDEHIMPTRVVGLGHQTLIEMPASVAATNLPALLLEDRDGNSEEITNVRFKDGRYILDQPIYKAFLISGVGWDQSKVEITKIED